MDIPKLYKYRYFNESMVSKNGLPNSEQIPQWQQVLYDGLIFPPHPRLLMTHMIVIYYCQMIS